MMAPNSEKSVLFSYFIALLFKKGHQTTEEGKRSSKGLCIFTENCFDLLQFRCVLTHMLYQIKQNQQKPRLSENPN